MGTWKFKCRGSRLKVNRGKKPQVPDFSESFRYFGPDSDPRMQTIHEKPLWTKAEAEQVTAHRSKLYSPNYHVHFAEKIALASHHISQSKPRLPGSRCNVHHHFLIGKCPTQVKVPRRGERCYCRWMDGNYKDAELRCMFLEMHGWGGMHGEM